MAELLDNIPTDETGGIINIGDSAFVFKFIIFDSTGQYLVIRKPAIEELIIIDEVDKFFHYGNVTIKNPYEVLERAQSVTKDGIQEKTSSFSFRNDGDLMIYFAIEPQISGSKTQPDKLNSEAFSMEFIFSVIHIDDPDDDTENKKIQLYFTDIRQKLLYSTDSFYSTLDTYVRLAAEEGFEVNPRMLPNHEVYTGNAIKDLLQTALEPYYPINFSCMWDRGSTKIEYTAPTDRTAEYDLKYLLAEHQAIEEKSRGPCILGSNRFVKDNKFLLMSLTDLFANSNNKGFAAALSNELFLLGSPASSNPDPKLVKVQRVPKGGTAATNLHLPDKSIITKYNFIEMSPDVNDELLTSAIAHAYNHSDGQFDIYCEKGFIGNVRKKLKDDLISKLIVDKQSGGEVAFDTNSKKLQNRRTKHTFYTTQDPNFNSNVESNRIIMESLMKGRRLEFEVPGMTHRRSMSFIAVDRQEGSDDNNLDNKQLGMYFVTGVEHIFDENGYTNRVTGTKNYNFKSMKR